jgi:hypothetical protein
MDNEEIKKKKVIDIDCLIMGKRPKKGQGGGGEGSSSDMTISEVVKAISPILRERFLEKLQEVLGGGSDNYALSHFDFGEGFPLGEGANTTIFWCGAFSEERENEGIVLSTIAPDATLDNVAQYQLLVAPYGVYKRVSENGSWGDWEELGGGETATSEEVLAIWNETDSTD